MGLQVPRVCQDVMVCLGSRVKQETLDSQAWMDCLEILEREDWMDCLAHLDPEV